MEWLKKIWCLFFHFRRTEQFVLGEESAVAYDLWINKKDGTGSYTREVYIPATSTISCSCCNRVIRQEQLRKQIRVESVTIPARLIKLGFDTLGKKQILHDHGDLYLVTPAMLGMLVCQKHFYPLVKLDCYTPYFTDGNRCRECK